MNHFMPEGLWGLVAAAAAAAGLAGGAAAQLPTRPGPDYSDIGTDPSGNLTISIPVATPPGIADTTPRFELGYSSGAGNGLLGVGWRVNGLSQIQRCAAIPATDGRRGSVNFDANDRFCLDGARLIAVSGAYGAAGSVYRTEIESWRQITASSDQCGSGP